MYVDKFGRRRYKQKHPLVNAAVRLKQMNETFLRRDGTYTQLLER